MAVIAAVVTEDARKYWPQFFGGLLGTPGTPTVPGSPPTTYDPRIKFFKVGEGGWINPGTGKVPRAPVSTLRRALTPFIQDLDAAVDSTRSVGSQRYPTDSRATFKKDLVLSDFSYESPSVIRVRCFLDFSEFNDDGFGNFPEIWEVAVFADHPEESGLAVDQGLMLAYATFPLETKTGAKQIENVVRLVF